MNKVRRREVKKRGEERKHGREEVKRRGNQKKKENSKC